MVSFLFFQENKTRIRKCTPEIMDGKINKPSELSLLCIDERKGKERKGKER